MGLGEVEKQTVHKSEVVQTMAEATTAEATTAEATMAEATMAEATTAEATMQVVMMVASPLMVLHLLIWSLHYKPSRTNLTTARKRRVAPPINWINHSITLN